MKVTINNHPCTIGWHYESKVVNKAMAKLRITSEQLKGMNKKEITRLLNLKSYPLPDSTHCIIQDTVTGDMYTGTVKRYHLDPWSREQARKRALTKAVWELFPAGKDVHNDEHSNQRKLFWDAYHNRIKRDPKNNIQKCIKKGLFSLEDVANFAREYHSLTFVRGEAKEGVPSFSIH